MTLDNEELIEQSPADLGAAVGAEPSAAPAAPAAPAEPVKEMTLKEELQSHFKALQERPRDEHGRFKPAEQEAKPDGPQPTQTQLQDPTKVAQPAPAAVQPPTSWAPEAKAEFAKLPRSVQDAISKRETEVHKGFTSLDEDRNLGKQMKDVISPYMPIITAEGGNPVAAVRDLMNSAYLLRTGSPEQKEMLVNRICLQYGVDLQGVLARSANAQVAPQPQQQQALTREEIAQIAREEQHNARLRSDVDTFAADPANKHYSVVRQHMAALLMQGVATSLKDAYEQACRAHPQISSSLQAEQSRATEEQRQAALRQKANAAKHAGGSVRGGPGATLPPTKSDNPNRSLREEIAANLRAAQEGI